MGFEGNNRARPCLPEAFCWTKFGVEAGEPPLSIFQRKELERRRNGGIFLWGIGQSIGPSLPDLLRVTPSPEVLFSPIRTPAAAHDVSPAGSRYGATPLAMTARGSASLSTPW